MEIASSNFPLFDRNLNSKITLALGREEDAQKAVQEILHEAIVHPGCPSNCVSF